MPRPPRIPDREELPEDEREAYDAIVKAGQLALEVTRDGEKVFAWDHAQLFLDYYGRMLVSPNAARAIRMVGGAARKMEYTGGGGSFSPADHELIDLVLCFDAGYWALLRIHTPSAVIAGVSVDTVEALRDGREEDLDEDTRFVVRFIREVAVGTLTDESWNRMERRLGSERGVVDFAILICILQLHLRMHHVLKVPPIPPEEYSEMLAELRKGPVTRSRAEAQAFVSER
jgi:hypothetical protein